MEQNRKSELDDLRSYYDRLAKHDWYYEYANGRTYEKGLSEHTTLKQEAKEDPAKAELFDLYHNYMWKHNVYAKPQRP